MTQTYLPLPDFAATAAVLDRQRLGKQRTEAKRARERLDVLSGRIVLPEGTRVGWLNHPAVRMWQGHEEALTAYGIAICTEWRARGYRDNQLPWFEERVGEYGDLVLPSWLGDEAIHAAYRGCLLAKDFEWYSQFGWAEAPTPQVDGRWPYVWPTDLQEAA